MTTKDPAGLLREAALDAIKRAEQAVDDLCQGRLRWEMRVPAEPDHDPDLIISDALTKARAALKAATGDSEGPSTCDCTGQPRCVPHEHSPYMETETCVEHDHVERRAAGDSEGPGLPWAERNWAALRESTARLSSKEPVPYDKPDHAAREGVPEGDLG